MQPGPEEERGAAPKRRDEAELRRALAAAQGEVASMRVELRRAREGLKLARLKLEQTESSLANLSMLFTSAAVPIIVCDLDAHITDLNAEAERRWNVRRRELLGMRLHALVPEERHSRLDELLKRCRADQTVNNAAAELWGEAEADEHPRTTLSPLRGAGGEVAGIVLAEDMRELVQATKLLEEVNQGLQEQLFYDTLTQIGNRRLFERDLARESGRAARQREPLSLLMIDVDRFKDYNDTHGHVAGDACLRSVGRAIRGALCRPTDSVARYGGEEFVVLLPQTDARGARELAERIRQRIRKLDDTDPGLARQVTASIGVATAVGEPGMQTHALLEAADRGLYRAKDTGRDRVCVAQIDGGPEGDAVSGP